MAKWGSCDFSQLKSLHERLQKLEDADLDTFCRDASKELAARLLALVIPRTPVGTKPELQGSKTEKVEGASGKKRTFLTAEGARLAQYWGGYDGGTLRRGWTAKTHEEAEGGSGKPSAAQAAEYAKSLAVTKSGNDYIIEIVNPVLYAEYVEYGHRQTPGRYVPAIGKRLKNGWVPGKYMLTMSEEDLERIAPGILQKKLENKLREVFGGGGDKL